MMTTLSRLSVLLIVALPLVGCPESQVSGDDDVSDDDTSASDDDSGGPVDADADGWDETEDCDDNDNTINPQAGDGVGDGIDQNCDGVDGTDEDGDGYASAWSGGDDCDDDDASLNHDDFDADGVTSCAGDCDDASATVYPGAEVVCDDGLDNDCDGVDERCGEDVFVQSGNHVVDLLFVVDDSSPDLAVKHQQLGDAFGSMLGPLTGIDFRVGVVTTDDPDLQGGVWIEQATPDPAATFAELVQVGGTGGVPEQGFLNGLQALERAADGQAPNAGFLRDRAGVRLIVCSDEDDQSPDDVPPT